jgi:two-component system OmpR family response regulator
MRLLIVEPHALLARALRRGLEEEGFTVDAVAHPEGADERLSHAAYDLILIDLGAEVGLEVVRRWRGGGVGSPVLLLREPGREAEPVPELAGDSLDTLNKPFILEDLLNRARALVRSRGKH